MLEGPSPLAPHSLACILHTALSRREDEAWCCTPNDEYKLQNPSCCLKVEELTYNFSSSWSQLRILFVLFFFYRGHGGHKSRQLVS